MRTDGTMKVAVFEEDITDIGIIFGLALLLEEAARWLRAESVRPVQTSSGPKYHQMYNVQLGLEVDGDDDTEKFTAQLFVHYNSNEADGM